MACDVLVVGGGVGGLTAAALLAARGVEVCLVERGERPGGCCAEVEAFGHRFEPGAGLYASWQPGEIHERVFAELPVSAPEVREVEPSYVVRLPEGRDVRVGGDFGEFADGLRAAFPECADAAINFYREATQVASALQRAARRFPALATLSKLQRMKLAFREARLSSTILARADQTAAQHLAHTSARFRRFVDAQLQIFAQVAADECAYLYAAVALAQPLRGMYAIAGGAQALADSLAEAVKLSGGEVRLNATALRLVFDSRGRAAGVELLSGERVEARRAVVSNLTIWDTYGKLVGAARTPPALRARLKSLRGWGAYQIFVSLDEEAARRLPAAHVLALDDRQDSEPFDPARSLPFDPERALLMLGVAPVWDARAPAGRRAATVSTFTEAEGWFTFHSDESEHEERDARALEERWARLHAALPELGAGAEVIETATPRTTYELTRRALGMVGGTGQSLASFGANAPTHRTSVLNLFMVGDTVFPGNGVAAVTQSALVVANEIAPPRR
ncbi:MAG TPA: FAD-dependent oxidoreductase [Pyrinomonadaceae bacterium]|jgi:C-3',4' desaturase CrtD|nr:FAD-dependent oxidoreductase [Pyrinomonadaceae bacterium]